MNNAPRFSIIIPVYNRPEEVRELLQSLSFSDSSKFELIIVEDGSSITCETIVQEYRDKFSIQYFFKPNEGPGPARNYGFQKARGAYFVVFDSDCLIPGHYFEAVEDAIAANHLDAWGGPDRPHENFTPIQRAMGYTMSAVLTTGGIRGGKKRIGWFQPRSFNMGISRKVFDVTGGFAFTRFAEDIEFSIRMKKAGFKVALIEDAYVYHKRRSTFREFFRQVSNFGKGRALLGSVHPEEIKLTHWFPTIFTTGLILSLLSGLVNPIFFLITVSCFAGYFFAIFLHSLVANRSFFVGLLSIPSAFLQLTGYGIGFFRERMKTYLRKSRLNGSRI